MGNNVTFGEFQLLSPAQERYASQAIDSLFGLSFAHLFTLDFSLDSVGRFEQLAGALGVDIEKSYPESGHRARAWIVAGMLAPYLGETLARTIPGATLGWCDGQLALKVEPTAGRLMVLFLRTKTAKRMLSEDESISALVAYVLATTVPSRPAPEGSIH